MAAEEVEVRATINLPGLRLGQTAIVDPADPYIADCLAAELIVPLDERDD